MKILYKKVNVIMPHCPICKSMLGGNGSFLLPYYCECGEWKLKDINNFKGEYEIINKYKKYK